MLSVELTSLTIRLNPELDEKLVKLAHDRELTRSEVAREALERLVRDYEREFLLKRMIAEYRVIPHEESVAFANEALATDNEALMKTGRAPKLERSRQRAKR